VLSLLELVQFLALEIGLEAYDLFKQFLDVLVDIFLNELELLFLLVVEVAWVNSRAKCLTILKGGTHLVREPGSDGCSASRSRILGVIDDIFLDQVPVDVSELKGLVHCIEGQIGGVAVFHHIVLEFVHNTLLLKFVNVRLVVMRSVVSEFE